MMSPFAVAAASAAAQAVGVAQRQPVGRGGRDRWRCRSVVVSGRCALAPLPAQRAQCRFGVSQRSVDLTRAGNAGVVGTVGAVGDAPAAESVQHGWRRRLPLPRQLFDLAAVEFTRKASASARPVGRRQAATIRSSASRIVSKPSADYSVSAVVIGMAWARLSAAASAACHPARRG